MAGDQGAGGRVTRPIVSLIAAVARNGVIGARGGIPWRLPSDLARFKALTMGKTLIMGRKTFESIGVPLPGRRTIVVTRDSAWSRSGVAAASDIGAALRLALAESPEEIMIAGGGEIYAATIGIADRLNITEIDLAPEGDAWFPEIHATRWRVSTREAGVRAPRDDADFTFVDYRRIDGG